jgi:hypothetical protein
MVTLTAICRILPRSLEPWIVNIVNVDLLLRANRIEDLIRLVDLFSLITISTLGTELGQSERAIRE